MRLKCFFHGHWWTPETRSEDEFWPQGLPGEPNFEFTNVTRKRVCERCGHTDSIYYREYPQGDGSIQVEAAL